MGRKAFENYGKTALRDVDYTVLSGRYTTVKEAEKRIVADVAAKLALAADDDLLEIGCGVGNVLIPLSFLVRSATGLDHANCIAKLSTRFPSAENITLLSGNFIDFEFDRTFPKILIYNLIQLLADGDEVCRFVMKAAKLLWPGGRLLVGDILNYEKHARIERTAVGQAWHKQFWQDVEGDRQRRVAGLSDCIDKADYDHEFVRIDDALMFRLMAQLRSEGFESYLLPQPSDLPFGLFREDLLVTR
jgi:cyclopropane fatty-acyl-phospholipid synthase-like methyltransferase